MNKTSLEPGNRIRDYNSLRVILALIAVYDHTCLIFLIALDLGCSYENHILCAVSALSSASFSVRLPNISFLKLLSLWHLASCHVISSGLFNTFYTVGLLSSCTVLSALTVTTAESAFSSVDTSFLLTHYSHLQRLWWNLSPLLAAEPLGAHTISLHVSSWSDSFSVSSITWGLDIIGSFRN